MVRNTHARWIAFLLATILGIQSSIGQNIVPLPFVREAPITCVWVKGGKEGGTSQLSVRIAENTAGVPQLAFSEGRFNVAGNMWKTAGWVAAFVACREAGISLADREFTFVLGANPIDGPSAGMLFCATLLAMLDGETPRQDVTITGTINPDGTIGPVGGVHLKLQGAAKSGIKKFGLPIGSRMHYAQEENKFYDLVEMGQGLGVETQEISDIEEAYEFLTGKKRAKYRPNLPMKGAPVMSVETLSRVRAAVLNQETKVAARLVEAVETNKRAGVSPDDWQPILGHAEYMARRARVTQEDSLPIVAYYDLLQANALILSSLKSAQLLEVRAKKGYGEMIVTADQKFTETKTIIETLELALAAPQLDANLSSIIDRLNAEILLCEARANLEAGVNYLRLAFAQIKKDTDDGKKLSQQRADELFKLIDHAMLFFSIAEVRAVSVQDWMAFAKSPNDTPVIVPEKHLTVLASAYGAGSDAVVNYFQETIIEGHFESLKASAALPLMSANEAREFKVSNYSMIEPSFAPLRIAARNSDTQARQFEAENQPKESGELPSLDYKDTPIATFAYGAYAYTGITNLLFRKSRMTIVTEAGEQLTNRKALGQAMDLARDRAFAKVSQLASLNGSIPESIVTNLNLAEAKRYGDDTEKLQAFGSYWRCSLLTDLAIEFFQYRK